MIATQPFPLRSCSLVLFRQLVNGLSDAAAVDTVGVVSCTYSTHITPEEQEDVLLHTARAGEVRKCVGRWWWTGRKREGTLSPGGRGASEKRQMQLLEGPVFSPTTEIVTKAVLDLNRHSSTAFSCLPRVTSSRSSPYPWLLATHAAPSSDALRSNSRQRISAGYPPSPLPHLLRYLPPYVG